MNLPKRSKRKSTKLTIDYLEESTEETNEDDVISIRSSKEDNNNEDEETMQTSFVIDEDDKDDAINKSITSFESAGLVNLSEGVSNNKVIVLEDNLNLDTNALGVAVGSGKINIEEDADEGDTDEENQNSNEKVTKSTGMDNDEDKHEDSDEEYEEEQHNNQETSKSSRKQNCPRKLNVPSNSWVDQQNRERLIAIANNTQELAYKKSHLFPTKIDRFGMEIMTSLYDLGKNESTIHVDRTWNYNKLKSMLNLREANVPGDGNCAIAAMLAVINSMKVLDENKEEKPKFNYCVHNKTIMKFRKLKIKGKKGLAIKAKWLISDMIQLSHTCCHVISSMILVQSNQ